MIEHVADAAQPRVRRRHWSDEIKARIVAESFTPGAVVSEVARQHDISPQQIVRVKPVQRAVNCAMLQGRL
jgi:transposase